MGVFNFSWCYFVAKLAKLDAGKYRTYFGVPTGKNALGNLKSAYFLGLRSTIVRNIFLALLKSLLSYRLCIENM